MKMKHPGRNKSLVPKNSAVSQDQGKTNSQESQSEALEKIKKKKRIRSRANENVTRDKIVVPLPSEAMSLRLHPLRVKRKSGVRYKDLGKTSWRSSAIIVIKKTTILRIIPSEKTSYSLGNLHVNDC